MSTTGPFRKLSFQLTFVVLGASLASLSIRHVYGFSVGKTLIIWIGTIIFGGLIAVAMAFVVAELDRREKEFYRTNQKKSR